MLFPAIAIPLERKRNVECPQAHIDYLTGVLPEVTKLLVIGWRGADAPFVEILKKHLRRPKSLLVAKDKADARNIMGRLTSAGLNIELFSEVGFSEFVVGRQAEDFLKS